MPIYDDLDDRHSKADKIERCRRDFRATGNPLFVWEAWGVVRFTQRSSLHESLEIPGWVSEYLDACGHRLLGWQPERVLLDPGPPRHYGYRAETNPPKRGEGPGSIGQAFGFNEGLARAREHWGGQHDLRERLAGEVSDLMWEQGQSLEAAATELEGTRRRDGTRWPERRTIRRYVEGSQRWALRTMQERLSDAGVAPPATAEIVRVYSDLCRRRDLTKQRG